MRGDRPIAWNARAALLPAIASQTFPADKTVARSRMTRLVAPIGLDIAWAVGFCTGSAKGGKCCLAAL